MAKRPTKRPLRGASTASMPFAQESVTFPAALGDDEHPDFQNGLVADEGDGAELDLPGPLPGPLPFPDPIPIPVPVPLPVPPIRFCGPVSGRYTLRPILIGPRPGPIWPRTSVTVRVDVDRFYPQQRISIEVTRLFPSDRAHAIAEVKSDVCTGLNRRRIEADITYRDGNPNLIPGDRVIFTARRTIGIGYSKYQLSLISGTGATRNYDLAFRSQYFDDVEFEVDTVANAGQATTTYDTGSHPNRPATLPAETVSFATTYKRAGFNVSMSPNPSNIPVAGAGANGTWSDQEMHDAMVTFWSRFADKPQWAMWVLFARQHDDGRGLGGIMFDSIGPNHRQGTAIFTDSFIQDVPAGDPNPAAWRNRMVYWTAIHEMGHAFNLAHAWQKSLGQPYGNPWIALQDEPESRSFMNYPYFVNGGEQAFFSDFAFRFSDDELIFMRHAPRRFVQMGNEDWFTNHGFEEDRRLASRNWKLEIRPNRDSNSYRFMEPVNLELKLTNISRTASSIDRHCLEDGRHVSIIVQRDGSSPHKWRPFVTACHQSHAEPLKAGESIYASHFVGAAANRWLIDEQGFYSVQAAVIVDGEMVVSNALRLYVGPPMAEAETKLAPDYFTEDVARVLAFRGAPSLDKANDVLRKVIETAPANPAATHAAVALAEPMTRDFKQLDTAAVGPEMSFRTMASKPEAAAKIETPALQKEPDAAATTLGHIVYRDATEKLTAALAKAGDKKEAAGVQKKLVDTLEKRGVLPSVVAESRRTLAKFTS